METGDARIEQISPAHSKAAQSGRPPPRWNSCNRLACLLRPGGWSGDFIADRIARTRDCVPISSSTSENQVCCFIALCEERSFNRAAICCGLAQSFLARAIHKLERDLGGRIFERRNSNIRLTVLRIWCGQIFCASVRLPELRISADSTDFSERFREEPPVWTGWNSQDS